jgi:lysozyme
MRSGALRHRWRFFLGGLAIVLAGALAFGWFVWLAYHRPTLRAGERYGIDVSHHQGVIDWHRVAEDDISFAYIKATEGGDFVDSRFDENWDGAGAEDLARGAYHFFTLCTPGDLQARNFLGVVPVDREGLPPALDLELTGNCGERPDPTTVKQEIEVYVRLVEEATGQNVLLYVREDFEAQYPVREWLDRPLWLSRFLFRPTDEWAMWQVGSFAKIEGIEGSVDLDVIRSLPTLS